MFLMFFQLKSDNLMSTIEWTVSQVTYERMKNRYERYNESNTFHPPQKPEKVENGH